MINYNKRYTHDCDACKFLGQHAEYDIYWCVNPRYRNLDSVLARYSDDGPDYISMHPPEAFADKEYYSRARDWYKFALKQAKENNLYEDKNNIIK